MSTNKPHAQAVDEAMCFALLTTVTTMHLKTHIIILGGELEGTFWDARGSL